MSRGAGGRRVADQRRSPDRGSMSGSPGPASSRGLHGQPGFRDLSKLFALPVAAPVVGHRVATNQARSAREPLVNQRRVKPSPNDRHERPGTPRARRGGAACASGAAASSPSCRPCHPEPPPPDEGRVCAGGPSDGLVHPRSASIGPSDWRARARTSPLGRESSATAANILQPCGGSGLFRGERVPVTRRRGAIGLDRFRGLWRKRRIVTGEAGTGALDRAAIRLHDRSGPRGWARSRREQERCRPQRGSHSAHADGPVTICPC